MSAATHAAFRDILLGGRYVAGGMPRWDDLFSVEDVDAIHAYLIDEQRRTRARELDLQRRGLPLDAPSAAILSSY
jgi:quinohemoprotein ethanol dehydrogenase